MHNTLAAQPEQVRLPSPSEQMTQSTSGHVIAQALYVVAALGIADLLATGTVHERTANAAVAVESGAPYVWLGCFRRRRLRGGVPPLSRSSFARSRPRSVPGRTQSFDWSRLCSGPGRESGERNAAVRGGGGTSEPWAGSGETVERGLGARSRANPGGSGIRHSSSGGCASCPNIRGTTPRTLKCWKPI